MKDTYYKNVSALGGACIDLVELGEFKWEVTRVVTAGKWRRRGHATELMAEVCRDADEQGVTLTLHINPYGEMSYECLQEWYESIGFVEVEAGRFERSPGAPWLDRSTGRTVTAKERWETAFLGADQWFPGRTN